jgi:hypothetical protein
MSVEEAEVVDEIEVHPDPLRRCLQGQHTRQELQHRQPEMASFRLPDTTRDGIRAFPMHSVFFRVGSA